MNLRTRDLLTTAALLALLAPRVAHAADIRLERVPDNGLQPQVRAGADGTLHLVYLTGNPKSADVRYRRRAPGAKEWGPPLRVNSEPGSAIAIGTIRGAQLALGRNERVHVAWNGSGRDEAAQSSPMLHARLNDAGTAFEAQRNVMTATAHLDGGGSVAADGKGNVFVVWHAGARGGPPGEANRAVYVAASKDDGATFAPERIISPRGSGACGCCGLTAHADAQGDLFIAFRIAATAMKRDLMMLRSTDGGARFTPVLSHPWNIGTCPMSSAAITPAGDEAWAAWETAGKVFMAKLTGGSPRLIEVATGKHPRTATNKAGATLVVWTEGTGWQRGGALAWQLYDAQGRPSGQRGRQDGLPAWTFPAVFAQPDSGFVILH
jgi:hypothetical protein